MNNERRYRRVYLMYTKIVVCTFLRKRNCPVKFLSVIYLIKRKVNASYNYYRDKRRVKKARIPASVLNERAERL